MTDMKQGERLDYLIEEFKHDSERYKSLQTPGDTESKRILLRSLMNVRMPGMMPADVLTVQDEYLKERIRENGIVSLDDIPTIAKQGSSYDHAGRISLWKGDITRLAVDAIVNAANSEMLGCFIPNHHCIDNCIHTFAGIQLRAECSRKMSALREKYGQDYEQPTAVPMLTDGYNLPAKKVIHVVGPIVECGLTEELEEDLASCYCNALDMCLDNGLRSIAFCCISTGVFHFPNGRAAEIAVKTVTDWLNEHEDSVDRVIFNVFNNRDRGYYEHELQIDQ